MTDPRQDNAGKTTILYRLQVDEAWNLVSCKPAGLQLEDALEAIDVMNCNEQ